MLLDIKMPKIDGVTAFKEIRKRYPEIQVIFVTAHANIDIVREAMNLGAYGFIMKPFDTGKLLKIVGEAFGSRH